MKAINVSPEGLMTWQSDGEPYLPAAFLTPQKVVPKALPHIAKKIPVPFVLNTHPSQIGRAGDYLMEGPDGLFVISNEEFKKKWQME